MRGSFELCTQSGNSPPVWGRLLTLAHKSGKEAAAKGAPCRGMEVESLLCLGTSSKVTRERF